MIAKYDPLVATQVATRGVLAGLPVSAATLELINKAKVDLRKRDRGDGDPRDPRVCRHCNETFRGSVFKHLDVCKKKPAKPAKK